MEAICRMEVVEMAQRIHEGTAQELAPLLARSSEARFRLIELGPADEKTEEAGALLDPENAASIALLKSWIAAAPTDVEEIRVAEEELSAFKRNMNQPRKEGGERLLYPEVE